MRGIAPAIGYTLVIALSFIMVGALYFWSGTQVQAPEENIKNVVIEAHALNSTHVSVTNLDTFNSTLLVQLDSERGPCSFGYAEILEPGIPKTCFFTNPQTTSVTLSAKGIKSVIVNF